jgi:methyl-accepting chemotaxis protein
MPEDAFRMVVTIGVALAALAFVAQSAAMVGMYLAFRRMQRKAEPLLERAQPAVAQLSKAAEKLSALADKAAPVVDQAGEILLTAHAIMDENRPRIAEIATEAAGIAKTGREQVERLGNIVNETAERARARVEQIDRSVDNTVESIEQAGDAMKRAAMRPVREATGIAAGISAAVGTLMYGKKYPVDHATQDEEMFI